MTSTDDTAHDLFLEIFHQHYPSRDADDRPTVLRNGFDLLLEAMIKHHGEAGRPDIAPQLQRAAELLARCGASAAYRRLLAS
jgi:hypothetical protein